MKFFRRLLLIVLIVIISIVSFVIYNGYSMYKNSIAEISIEDKVQKVQSNSDFVKIDNVPDYYINAIIAVEDHRYREHGAFDAIAICRAIVSNFQAKELNEGGSTITQQVAKNLYYIGEDNFVYRKIAEAFVANALEEKYSKDEILEIYYNTIYFGSGYYGIKQASNGYYSKEPKDLSLDEATLLAGVPNAPSVYSPNVNPDLAKNRQAKVLRSMVEYGYLSQEEADKVIKEN